MNFGPKLLPGACVAACLLLCLSSQAQTGNDVAGHLRAGREAAQSGDFFAALRAFATARQLDPQNKDAERAVADMLVELGAPFGAAALGSPADPGLRSRQAASQVRWGQQITPADPALRYADTDRAIAALQGLLLEARAQQPLDIGLVTRLLRDQAVALRDRKRWSEVLQTTQELRNIDAGVPAYVRHAEADALLSLRRPGEARVAYADVLAQDSANRDALVGRLYAELEDEDLSAVLATADQMQSSGQASRRFGKVATVEADPDWLDAQIVAAQVRGYVDLPAQAWDRLLPLAQGAPALPYLRAALGGVAAQRGWTRLGAEEIAIANSLAPDDAGLQLARVESDIRRRQWRRAQQQLDAIVARDPYAAEEPGVGRAQRDLDNYRAPELRLEFGINSEDGGGVNAPGDGTDSSITFTHCHSPSAGALLRPTATTGRPCPRATRPARVSDWGSKAAGPMSRWRPSAGTTAMSWPPAATACRRAGSPTTTGACRPPVSAWPVTRPCAPWFTASPPTGSRSMAVTAAMSAVWPAWVCAAWLSATATSARKAMRR